ncbi:MAG: tetratricopeptide repeat protein [Muribaculaceae bacterium]|nr:tetratricopeptide repeat protein [Muribaculaceae bacterium]
MIRELLGRGKSEEAIKSVNESLSAKDTGDEQVALLLYYRGNAYRQMGDYARALNSYLESMECNPDGPAAEAYRSLQEILQFYDKDRYNP